MLDTKQNIGTGTTLFTVEKDETGWKAVVTRDGKILKQSYALDRAEADSVRTMYINQFWGNKLN